MEVLLMIRSGEWFGAQALNAMRHRMGSQHAIDTVAARRSSQQRFAHASQRSQDPLRAGNLIAEKELLP
jgi:hypothetical protein